MCVYDVHNRVFGVGVGAGDCCDGVGVGDCDGGDGDEKSYHQNLMAFISNPSTTHRFF